MEIEKIMTPRFYAIAKLVPKCKTLADIGTDHAYIPTYLLLKNIIKHAIAMDIKSGPLIRAESTLKKYDCLNKAELRLSDGLIGLNESEADVIVIAGMGGLLINEILKKDSKRHTNATFILQPMTAEDEVRRYLEKNSFEIIDEKLAREGDKLYHVISAKFGKMKIEKEINYYLGEKLFLNNDENISFAINKLILKYENIIIGQNKAKNTDNDKVNLANRLLKELKKLKKE